MRLMSQPNIKMGKQKEKSNTGFKKCLTIFIVYSKQHQTSPSLKVSIYHFAIFIIQTEKG